MSVISPLSTLGEIVNLDRSLARQLERRGLDYCCRGSRTLEQACREEGLDPGAVTTELDAARTVQPEPDWLTMDAVELVDHIEATHHRYLWEEFPRLTALMDKVCSVHGRRHPELNDARLCLTELRDDLERHLLKEERVLFPMVRQLAVASHQPMFHCGSISNPISVMLQEHDRAGDLLALLRAVTGNYSPPSDGCASYAALFQALSELEDDTHLHVHKENNVLFPMVEALEAGLPC